ncbi:transmembrane transport protein [Dactylosporangium sp. AC04546]|uniref:transmembrane transport protein n=1 Tax=Dactylosporangium sp. AC04546 TaxID=2862460 RepID=UPI001EDD4272|nr:transmembrane transport protein [Dactylosporangium sp. AC04546]WVK83020.1 transmembrane transport protein [Dactylosporangium sp. AC04546]
MTWLSWRQFRTQALVAGAALLVLAVYLVMLGLRIRDTDAGGLMRYQSELYLVDALVLVAPGLAGMFWGAPLVARELETGTHRFVWAQSVSRRRWLAVKLLVVAGAATLATGLLSALLTWAAAPYDTFAGDRFTALLFGTRNLAPAAYAAFAVVLGATLGLLLRRTLPAMALTFVLFTAVQVAVPLALRPHLGTPVTGSQPITAAVVRELRFLSSDADIEGLQVHGGWVVRTSKLLAADGRRVDQQRYESCVLRTPEAVGECLEALNLHVSAAYFPADRYWRFQWLESVLYLTAAALLSLLSRWRVRHA